MILIRAIIIAFNVGVIGFLIYRMFQVVNQPMPRSKKVIILVGGAILLLAPFGIFLQFFMPTIQYFLIYPVAIAFYLYMIREL